MKEQVINEPWAIPTHDQIKLHSVWELQDALTTLERSVRVNIDPPSFENLASLLSKIKEVWI